MPHHFQYLPCLNTWVLRPGFYFDCHLLLGFLFPSDLDGYFSRQIYCTHSLVSKQIDSYCCSHVPVTLKLSQTARDKCDV